MVFAASMFDGPHLIYIFASLAATALIVWLGVRFIKKQILKDAFLKFWALATVFLHLLPLWVNFLMGEEPIVKDNMLFPIFFCNLSMFLLLFTAFWSNKSSKPFNYLAIVTSYSGIFGALISLFYPEYYFEDGTMWKLGVMKSMLSHSTMLIGSLYLLSANYFKIKVKQNTIVFTIGLFFFLAVGLIVNGIFALAGLEGPNAMYLQKPPIEGVPFLNSFVIGLAMIGLVALISFTITEVTKKVVKKETLITESN